ncbi:MAG TPA: M24 family metallopeptidase [Pyrinomonadaceae bacterium]|nr:M24 family metallopeptidase [Pyrinomonadaceae bacterium]
MSKEIEIKTERLVRSIGSTYAGVMLNAQHNFAWITGGANNAIDTSRENGAATILITNRGKRYLIANNIEMQRMLDEQVDASLFKPSEFRWQDEKATPDLVRQLAGDLAGGQVISDIPFTSAPALESTFSYCRFELTNDEQSRYRSLGKDAADAMAKTIRQLQPGKTENDIANSMRHELGKFGINSVVTLVAADDRIAKYRHPVPTENRFDKTLLLVTCAKRHGLIASFSRMVSIGEPSDDLKRRTEAAAFVNASLQHATRIAVNPETLSAELYAVAEQAYDRAGFPGEIDKHHQGGAAGYRTRDWVAHPSGGDQLFPQQGFAWNPSITGTKVEDTIIRNGNEIEVITNSAEFPLIESVIDGHTYISHGILTI